MNKYIWMVPTTGNVEQQLIAAGVKYSVSQLTYKFLIIENKVAITCTDLWYRVIGMVGEGYQLIDDLLKLPEPLKYPTEGQLYANEDGWRYKDLSKPEQVLVSQNVANKFRQFNDSVHYNDLKKEQ